MLLTLTRPFGRITPAGLVGTRARRASRGQGWCSHLWAARSRLLAAWPLYPCSSCLTCCLQTMLVA